MKVTRAKAALAVAAALAAIAAIAVIASIASIAAIATQRTQNTLRDMIYQYNQRSYCAFPLPLHQCNIAGHFERRVRMQASGTVGGNAFE